MLGVNAQQAEQIPGRDMRVVDFWEQRYLPYCEEIVPLTGHPADTGHGERL